MASTEHAGQNGFVGSWRATVFETDGPPTLALIAFGADGTVISAEHPVVTPPVAPGPILASAGIGAWRSTGPDTAILTSMGLGSLGNGSLFGTVTFRASIGLAGGGQTFTGEFLATINDPDGAELATFPGSIEGQRLIADEPTTARPDQRDQTGPGDKDDPLGSTRRQRMAATDTTVWRTS